MSEYTPDAWVILRIELAGEVIYKVLGGWHGGYLDADSWRLNSGITRIERDGDLYRIHGHSGSVYSVHPDAQRTNMLIASVIGRLQDGEPDADIQVVDVNEVSLQ